jgi:hypothetical protein
MKEKHLYIFAGVFVFLLIVYFITKPRHAGVNVDELVQNVVFGIAKEDIKNIEVYKETGSDEPIRMVFTQNEDKWYIPTTYNAKAQKSRIDGLLNNVLEMTGKVRSSDPKHFENYKISDAQGIHLLLKDEANKPLANLVIGKRGEDYNSGFVRFGGKEKVYAVDKNLLSSLNIYGEIDTLTKFNDNNFVDLQAVDQDKEKLELVGLIANGKELVIKQIERQVEVMNDDSTMTTKTEKEWVLLKGEKQIQLEQKEVDNFIRDVTKIRGQEVVDRIGGGRGAMSLGDLNKPARYGVNRPTHYIVFQQPEKEREVVLFGKEYEKDKGYYMHVQYDGLIYHLSKSTYDRIFKWVDDLPEKVKKES